MCYEKIVDKIKSNKNTKNIEGMKRFAITGKEVYGVPMPELRKIAKEAGKNHKLALKLWDSGIYEGRILACMIEDPKKITKKQADKWVGEFDSWAICDCCCGDLIDKTDFAYKKVKEWAKSDKEFVRRAAFATIAWLAVHDKKAGDKKLEQFLPLIKKYSTDERNFVKKAVNWSLRQIGKRNKKLNKKAIKLAEEMERNENKTARWIAKDALRELKSEKIKKRIENKSN